MLRGAMTKIAAFAAVVAAISGTPATAEPLKARLAQNLSPISGIVLVAKAKGLFEKHGLDITTSNFTTGKLCLDTVVGGGADIATTAEAPTTAAAMAKQPIAFLARMEYSDLKTLVAANSGIKTKADLKGKRIAFTAGTGSEVYTVTLLKAAGLTAKDVTLVNLRPQDMLPALAAGSIDAMDTWEPHITNAKKVLGDKARRNRHQGGLFGDLQHRRDATVPGEESRAGRQIPGRDAGCRKMDDGKSGRGDHDRRAGCRHEARRPRPHLEGIRPSRRARRQADRGVEGARRLAPGDGQSPAGRHHAGFFQGHRTRTI